MSAGGGFRTFIDPYLGVLKAVVIIAGALGLIWLGMKVERAGWEKKQRLAIERALDGERALQAEINQSTSDYIDQLKRQIARANALPKITMANDCTVPAAVGSVLNDAQRMHADAGDESGTGAARPAADSTCAAELDIAKRNYAEVCIPNAAQLNKLQEQWELVRSGMLK
ncbi:hypothetical protein [Oxalicibacterium faecigallinarum]|uniref:Uncharacterized protein n=1 Tax=Oxalicibacterium faecigallinarum TaxID=573741 RepID=A0A8J3ATB9_9BURK|nr:hypothetical protein [Oxalicibacterium faecigallinarum]GGI16472.1 hypothetical protein GCM10008066_04130 [Oxalicibacterium faecigallinarum]